MERLKQLVFSTANLFCYVGEENEAEGMPFFSGLREWVYHQIDSKF